MENKKYVIFEAQHLSGLYQLLTLKFKNFSDKNVILFVNKDKFSETSLAKNFIENDIFCKVVSFNEPLLKYGELTGLDFINNFYNKIFKQNEIDLCNIEEVITGCDVQNLFAIYCMENHVELSFVELHNNQFADKNRYEINRVYAGAPLWVEELSKKYSALSGDSKMVKTRYLYKDSKVEYKNKDINVDFLNEFYSLGNAYKQKICKCLGLENEKVLENCNILLTNSLGWSRPITKLDLPKHYLPYLLLADYYFNENLILKDHPQTPKEYFNKQIKTRFNTLDSETPIELFGLVEGFHVNKLISVNSTGNEKISRFVDNEVKLGVNYLENYMHLHKTFVTHEIEKLVCGQNTNYHAFNINTEFLSNYKKFALNETFKDIKGINPKILRGDIFAIINRPNDQQYEDLKLALADADEITKVVFWNVDVKKLFDFKNINFLDNMLQIKIKKEKLGESETLSDTCIETLYFYCKNEQIRNKVQNLDLEKELKYTNIKIKANCGKDILLETKYEILLSKVKEQDEIIQRLKDIFNNK